MQTRAVPISEVRAKRSLHALDHVLVDAAAAVREHQATTEEVLAIAKSRGVTLRSPSPQTIANDLDLPVGHVKHVLKERP